MENQLVVVSFDDLKSIIAKSIAEEFKKKERKEEEEKETLKSTFLTRKETAQLLGVCLATLDNWTREGKLIKYRNGHVVRYKKVEVLASFSSLQKYRRH